MVTVDQLYRDVVAKLPPVDRLRLVGLIEDGLERLQAEGALPESAPGIVGRFGVGTERLSREQWQALVDTTAGACADTPIVLAPDPPAGPVEALACGTCSTPTRAAPTSTRGARAYRRGCGPASQTKSLSVRSSALNCASGR